MISISSLVPGPIEEMEIIRRIYRLFVVNRLSESEIAATLNKEGRSNELGNPWTRATVRQVLTNEKYIGNNVYNRFSYKLGRERAANPPETWVRAEGVFRSVAEQTVFEAAQ